MCVNLVDEQLFSENVIWGLKDLVDTFWTVVITVSVISLSFLSNTRTPHLL